MPKYFHDVQINCLGGPDTDGTVLVSDLAAVNAAYVLIAELLGEEPPGPGVITVTVRTDEKLVALIENTLRRVK